MANRVFVPSPQQADFFRFVETPNGGNAIVEAVAGAGKTTSLVEGMKLMHGTVFYGVYNTKMAKEAREKCGSLRHVWVKTFHSMGMNSLRFNLERRIGHKLPDPDGKKVLKIIDEWIAEKGREDLKDVASTINKVVSMAKQRGIGVCFRDTDDEWLAMIDHFDLANDLPEGYEDRMDIVVSMSRLILNKSTALAQETGAHDFDDMIYLPLLWNYRFKKFEWVLVDECQPSGTMVEVPTGRVSGGGISTRSVPIETLSKGDRVVSYNRPLGVFKMGGDVLTDVRTRRYHGNMFIVQCGDRTTRYTENHWCWASMGRTNKQFFVYLMRRGSKFRVGHCGARWSGNKPGLSFRLYEESADSLWVLKAFDTKMEAAEYEQKIINESGIPGVRFEPNKNSSTTLIRQFWDAIVDNTKLAEKVLSAHGRSLWYPLMEKGEQQERDGTRFRMIRACNLMDGMTMRPFRGTSKATRHDEEITVSRQYVDETVYSLEVENTNMYVGDGIATHNCQDTNPTRRLMAERLLAPGGRFIAVGDPHQAIYGFSGADNDALEQIAHKFNAKILPLTVTYRCPKAVVEVAQQFVSHIHAHETAPDGLYTEQPYENITNLLQPGDAVICRYNKYLVSLVFKLIRLGMPAKIEGRQVGAGLISLIGKWKVKSLDVLATRVISWRDRESNKALAKKNETKAEEIVDRAETVLVLIERAQEQNITTIPEFKAMIESLFADDVGDDKSLITLLSAHKSKGLEYPRVFILGLYELMGRECYLPWQTVQEINLQYVSVTRAQEFLCSITGVKEEKKQHRFGEEG